MGIAQKLLIAILVFVVGMMSGAGAAWYFTRDHFKAIISTNEANYAEAATGAAQVIIDYQAEQQRITINAERDHAKNQLVIDGLTSDLGRVQRISGICASAAAKEDSSSSSANAASGVASGRVDADFARLQDRVSGIIKRCSQLNIDTIQLNQSVGAQ